MKQIERWRGGAALLLGALLSLPLSAVQPMTVHAAGREVRSVNVSIGDELGIANPEPPQNDTDEWKGDRVIFGEHGGNPITFRVLDKKTTDFGGTTMLLDCDSILYDRAFNETTASPSNV
ncbi:MAG: hypothetical protein ACTTK0_08510 [Stomatobaculum sp.]